MQLLYFDFLWLGGDSTICCGKEAATQVYAEGLQQKTIKRLVETRGK